MLTKVSTSGWQCDYADCKHNPKYHHNIIGNCFQLIQGETCLILRLGDSREIYCRECIDAIYRELKPVLDSKLWPWT